MFEKFTEGAIKVIMLSQEESRRMGHSFVGTEQILLGLIGQRHGVAAKALNRMAVTIAKTRKEIELYIGRGTGFVAPEIPFTPRAKTILEMAVYAGKEFGQNFVGTEHLLLAILEEGGGVAVRTLRLLRVDLYRLKTLTLKYMEKTQEGVQISSASSSKFFVQGKRKKSTPMLDDFAENMTTEARSGYLDPVIGRDKEIEDVIAVLARRRKNNPVLIGEPGVGKTAIAEGLAQLIVANQVPDFLEDNVILALDIGLILAGTKYRGEFEERIKRVIEEIEENPEIILVIDEIHTIVGAGAAEGAVDAANILKPALARGKFRCIGATTNDEYRKYIERDKALERRFQPVHVEAPSVGTTIDILQGLRFKFEKHHLLIYETEAIEQAAILADKYVADRQLPDKAIDVLDEAGARVRLNNRNLPQSIKNLLIELKETIKDKESSIKENDFSAAQELLEHEMEVRTHIGILKAAKNLADQQNSKIALANLDRLKPKYDIPEFRSNPQLMADSEVLATAESVYPLSLETELGKNTELIYQLGSSNPELMANPSLVSRIASNPELMEKIKSNTKLISNSECMPELIFDVELTPNRLKIEMDKVTETDVTKIISNWTGIPLTKLTGSESERLLKMEDRLHERIIGQHQAVVSVSKAIRRARVGLRNPNRPIASFIFAGPTGVGKTELTKTLSDYMFGSEDKMIRLDMSEFMEKHTVSKLIGSPPGYIGYEEGGQLTEAVRSKPYSVVLFDEVEKAHPDVFNLLLQILDDGRLSDSRGRVVNFTNTLIIMTTNLGSKIIERESGIKSQSKNKIFKVSPDPITGWEPKAEIAEDPEIFQRVTKLVNDELKNFFRPEFLNRIDEIIVFRHLTRMDTWKICELMIISLQRRLKEKAINLIVDFSVRAFLTDEGYDPIYGARPLRRAIMKYLEDTLAEQCLSKTLYPDTRIIVRRKKVEGSLLKYTNELEVEIDFSEVDPSLLKSTDNKNQGTMENNLIQSKDKNFPSSNLDENNKRLSLGDESYSALFEKEAKKFFATTKS